MQHTVHQLTDAKANAQKTPKDHEPPPITPSRNPFSGPRARPSASAGDSGDHGNADSDEDEDEDEDDMHSY